MLQFAAAGVAALLVLITVGALALARLSRKEAVDNAKQVTQVLARAVVEPALSNDLATADPRARARLDRIVRQRILRGDVVRVKLWNAQGRIVYSDRRELVGARYPLSGDDSRALLGSGKVEAEVSDLSRPENRFERRAGKLLEVYLPVTTPDGKRLLFETYQRYSAVTASGRQLWGQFAPALIGALLVFELVQLPLAWSLAKRLQRGQRDREGLLRRALDASDLERRRIASDLHDGAVQDLVAASYSLAAARDRVNGGDVAVGDALDRAAATSRGAVRQLRSLLVEIYPPRLREAGLESVLADLVAPLEEGGIEASVEIDGEARLPDDVEALFFRTAQEGVRNAVEHADPKNLRVRVTSADRRAVLSVTDDGRGFTPDEALDRRSEGHFGLRLLADLAQDADAHFTIESAPGRGTTVRVEAPLA
jgi:signal transduction histidine kinase/translation initiation factor IF-1